MTINVILLRNSAARVAVATALMLGSPLAAQDRNVRDRTPDMREIAITPITDLNLAKDKIPVVLLEAVERPYVNEGLEKCEQLAIAIDELDQVLGADLDVVPDEGGMSVGRAAQSVIGSFIPFRGVIRQLSGAADHQRKFQAAIFAGAVRRGYLKGLGEQKGCAYPARPAFMRIQIGEEDEVELVSRDEAVVQSADGVDFVSQEVVQEID